MVGKTILICAVLGCLVPLQSVGADILQLKNNGKYADPILSREVLDLLREPVKVSRQKIPTGLVVVATAREKKYVRELIRATLTYRHPSPCGSRPPQGVFITVTTLNNGIRLRITATEARQIRMIHRIPISNDSATGKRKK